MWSGARHSRARLDRRWSSATESAPPETATKTVSPPASMAWRRIVRSRCARRANRLAALEPYPALAVLEVLLLPHRNGPLERVDRVPARFEGIAAVLGGDGDQHAGLADLEPPGAMEYRDAPDARPARAHGLTDLAHLHLGHRRVRLVLQALDRAAVGLVSHDPREDPAAAGARIIHLGGDRVGRQRLGPGAEDVGRRAPRLGRGVTRCVVGR